jgi:hypothetical protein
MASLTPQEVALGGLQPAWSAASGGGDTAPVGTHMLLLIRNDGAGPATVTIATPGTVGGLTVGDATQTVPADGTAVVPLRSVYRDPATGRAAITYSDATSLDVAVIQVP